MRNNLPSRVVKGLMIEGKSGRQAVLSHVLVDCTGDADIACRAGAPTTVGREEDHKRRPMTFGAAVWVRRCTAGTRVRACAVPVTTKELSDQTTKFQTMYS